MSEKGARNTIASCCLIKNKPKSLFNFNKKKYTAVSREDRMQLKESTGVTDSAFQGKI